MEIRDLVIILKTRKESLMRIMTVKKWKIEIKKMGSLRTMVCRALNILWFVLVSYLFITVTTCLRKNNIWASAKAELQQKNTAEESYALDNQRALGEGGRKGPLGKIFPELPQSPASSSGPTC